MLAVLNMKYGTDYSFGIYIPLSVSAYKCVFAMPRSVASVKNRNKAAKARKSFWKRRKIIDLIETAADNVPENTYVEYFNKGPPLLRKKALFDVQLERRIQRDKSEARCGCCNAQEHWTKSYELKSAVERLYEELGALEFDADHEAIYGMERYYRSNSVKSFEINIRLEGSLLKKMWMLYAQEHWTKCYDLKSAVERLYEELGALEFDADHEAIYGMERYYTVQQCEELRDKYKIGRKVCRKFLQGRTCSQCLVKRISEIGLRHFLDTVNKYIKDCSDSSSSSDEEVFKAVEQNGEETTEEEEESKKAKVKALLNLFNNLLKDSLNHSLKLNTIFSSNFCRELSDRFSKGIEICNKYLNGNICLKCYKFSCFLII
ncbi:hypothetical protein FQA39_LY09120 [Lamprigera yunnana]|nr:hypothetical protein FQA39_LY09120 [Lamprigera yunnana]